MKVGHRSFIFEDSGNIRRLSLALFYDFFNGRPPVPLKEYAGKTIRSAFVTVGTLNRKPARLVDVDYNLYKVDADGFLDMAFRTEMVRTAVTMADPFAEKSRDILEALGPGLAKVKYSEKFRWRPTPAEQAALRSLIFSS